MAVGAIGAFFLYHYKSLSEKIFSRKYFFILNTIFLLAFLSINIEFPLKSIVFSFVVITEILFIIQDDFRVNLRNKYLEKIGDISYGVYMYHPFVMYICFSFFNSVVPVKNAFIYNLAIYSAIFLLTILISKLSFDYFESRFIALKNKKFTIILSGKTIEDDK
jgi:peptidoglycan/LPS O-acetylase OafA/YrhL